MKSGFVSILGRPNVGKSTLLNCILNTKISIVTDKSQTTRDAIKGIYNSENSQIIFVDTPGIHKPHAELGIQMNNAAYSTAHDVDINILVIDASEKFGEGDQFLIEHLDTKNTPLVLVFNKIDKANIIESKGLQSKYLTYYPNAIVIEMVAKEGFNKNELLEIIEDNLPEGPRYYPVDVLTDKDDVFRIKEIIREKTLKILSQEVPHSIAIYIDNINYNSTPLKISASIIVDKESHKGIVIGKNGKRIKEIGEKSRRDIEKILHKHVFLDLHVRVEADWRNKKDLLARYGYKYK